MNATQTHQTVLTLRTSLILTKSIPRRPSQAILCQINQPRFASTSSQSSTEDQNGLTNVRGILTIAVPSVLLTWGVLEYYDPHQRGQHSHMMRQALLDENKSLGRAHGCAEVHVSDVEKWVEQHPEYVEHWKKLRKEYEDRK